MCPESIAPAAQAYPKHPARAGETGEGARAPHGGWSGPTIVLVGLMGAGKTSIGRRLAQRLGLPFADADHEIAEAAGMTIAEIFARFGEPAFRAGERRVIARLMKGPRIVLATGGGAFADPETRAAIRAHGVSVWLKGDVSVLARRVAGRTDRPLLAGSDPAAILEGLAGKRNPLYAEADIIVPCADESAEGTTSRVHAALLSWRPALRVPVPLEHAPYDVAIGAGLLDRVGALAAPLLPARRAVVIADATVHALHGARLTDALAQTGIEGRVILVPPGEQSKSFATYEDVMGRLIAGGIDRRTAIIAFGGGVVGDLAGFVAATALRGLPFIQVPTTLLAQVDSSVGGKTAINTASGKNLVGAFHQPRLVVCDTAILSTLPGRELSAGYAEVVKYGLLGDARFFDWCEANLSDLMRFDPAALAEAVRASVAAKADVVADDEREQKSDGGRALLNLGHTFGHALEAEVGYDGQKLLHGEAVAIGMGLAFSLSARLGHCGEVDAVRVRDHLARAGLPASLSETNRRFSAARLVGHMRRDKKADAGQLTFILARAIGQAFVSRDVTQADVIALLRDEGCAE